MAAARHTGVGQTWATWADDGQRHGCVWLTALWYVRLRCGSTSQFNSSRDTVFATGSLSTPTTTFYPTYLAFASTATYAAHTRTRLPHSARGAAATGAATGIAGSSRAGGCHRIQRWCWPSLAHTHTHQRHFPAPHSRIRTVAELLFRWHTRSGRRRARCLRLRAARGMVQSGASIQTRVASITARAALLRHLRARQDPYVPFAACCAGHTLPSSFSA